MNVEQKAFSDERFVRLGVAIGGDRWAALGRMTLVWNTCQERENHTLSRETVNAIHADIVDFASLIVKCELARESRRGLYIAGAKERTVWLGKARKNGKLGGRPRKNHTVTTEKPSGSAENNPPAPAPAPTEESKTSRPTRTARTFTDDSREMKAARYLFGKIRTNNAEAKEPNWQTWAREFDLIFRVDKREPNDVRKLVDFTQADPFWLKNVLSPAALRKQYDRLTVNAKEVKPEFDRTRPVV